MPMGVSNPQGQNGTLNGAGTGGITDAPFYGTPMQQMADPLHLFPSPMADNSAPSQLPNLGINAKFYGGNFVPQGGGGYWNNMAGKLAGPRYVPMAAKNPGGNPGAVHPNATGQTNIAAILARLGGMR